MRKDNGWHRPMKNKAHPIFGLLHKRRINIGLSRRELARLLRMNPNDIAVSEKGGAKYHTFVKVMEWMFALGLSFEVVEIESIETIKGKINGK